uniref:Uncharacterized protein n=1 Tax=Glossina brevipalpis TaxID=37001 RepID=A0A1A9WL08_9MUSC
MPLGVIFEKSFRLCILAGCVPIKLQSNSPIMISSILENGFLGQDFLYFQTSLTSATLIIILLSNKNKLRFGYDNGSLNNLQYKPFADNSLVLQRDFINFIKKLRKKMNSENFKKNSLNSQK